MEGAWKDLEGSDWGVNAYSYKRNFKIFKKARSLNSVITFGVLSHNIPYTF